MLNFRLLDGRDIWINPKAVSSVVAKKVTSPVAVTLIGLISEEASCIEVSEDPHMVVRALRGS
jgi:hypothetical protein